MKKIILIVFLLLATLLTATQQLSYQVELDDEAFINSLDSYYYGKIAGFNLANSSALRYATEGFAEDTYLSRYLRNRLWLNKSYQKLQLAGFFYFGIYPEGNVASHLAGIVQPRVLQNSWAGGVSAKYQEQFYVAEIKLRNLVDNFDNDLTDSDLLGELEIASRNLPINPYLKIDYYNDLNEDARYNYQEIGIGLSHFRKISFSQFLDTAWEVGSSDIYENIPYYTRLRSRLTTNILQNWFILNRIDFAAYVEEEFSQIYDRKSITEHLLQYNYGHDGNSKNYLNLGLKASLQGEFSGKFAAKYCFRYANLLIKYQHFINDAAAFDGKASAEIEISVNRNLSILIADQFAFGEQTEQNRLIIAAEFRR